MGVHDRFPITGMNAQAYRAANAILIGVQADMTVERLRRQMEELEALKTLVGVEEREVLDFDKVKRRGKNAPKIPSERDGKAEAKPPKFREETPIKGHVRSSNRPNLGTRKLRE